MQRAADGAKRQSTSSRSHQNVRFDSGRGPNTGTLTEASADERTNREHHKLSSVNLAVARPSPAHHGQRRQGRRWWRRPREHVVEGLLERAAVGAERIAPPPRVAAAQATTRPAAAATGRGREPSGDITLLVLVTLVSFRSQRPAFNVRKLVLHARQGKNRNSELAIKKVDTAGNKTEQNRTATARGARQRRQRHRVAVVPVLNFRDDAVQAARRGVNAWLVALVRFQLVPEGRPQAHRQLSVPRRELAQRRR